jgi:hypothetical protein
MNVDPADIHDVISALPKLGANIVTPNVDNMTAQQLVAEMRVLPYGYRVVITQEPSMLMHGREATMVTLWYGKEMLTRHLHYTD